MQEIGLQDLINQVKHELLEVDQAQRARDPYPLFAIDNIELELTLNISYGADGAIKLTVPAFGELSAGGSGTRERGHVVKIALAPLIPREEVARDILNDTRARSIIVGDLCRAILKGDEGRAGLPE